MRNNFSADVLLYMLKSGWHKGARLPWGKPFTGEMRNELIKHINRHRQSLLTLSDDTHGKATNAIQVDGRSAKARNEKKSAGIGSPAIRMAS